MANTGSGAYVPHLSMVLAQLPALLVLNGGKDAEGAVLAGGQQPAGRQEKKVKCTTRLHYGLRTCFAAFAQNKRIAEQPCRSRTKC